MAHAHVFDQPFWAEPCLMQADGSLISRLQQVVLWQQAGIEQILIDRWLQGSEHSYNQRHAE